MKNHLYFTVVAGILLAVAFQADVAAQSAGNNSAAVQPQSSTLSPRQESLKAIEKAINQSRRELELAENSISDQLKALEERSVSDIAFHDVFRMLHLQKAELTIEVEGLNARLELLKREAEKAISGWKESETSIIQREAAKHQLAITKKRYETTKKLAEKGVVSSNELATSKYEMEVAELQLRANDARAKQASTGLVEEMFKTSLEIAEKKARQKTVQNMLRNYSESRSAVSKLENLVKSRIALSTRIRELLEQAWRIDQVNPEN